MSILVLNGICNYGNKTALSLANYFLSNVIVLLQFERILKVDDRKLLNENPQDPPLFCIRLTLLAASGEKVMASKKLTQSTGSSRSKYLAQVS